MTATKTTKPAAKATPTRAQKDAARANKKAAAVVATRVPAVGDLIAKAGQAAHSMFSLTREAATAAAAQLNPAKPIKERIAEVMSLYAADLTAAGPNVKAIFGDALTLHACAQVPVVVAIPGKDGKLTDTAMTAGEAVNTSKHAMRDATKQVRDAMGIGRKSGGGRKASAPASAPPSSKVQQPATVTASEIDNFTAWLDMLPEYVADKVYHARIVAVLVESGWTLSRAVKGRKVQGAASAAAPV